jgi:hypothetical protein
MMYPWPLAERHEPLNEALEIAMGYLELTRQAYPYSETQVRAADAILAAWRSGVRHKVRLATTRLARSRERTEWKRDVIVQSSHLLGPELGPESAFARAGTGVPARRDGPPLSQNFFSQP